MVSLAEVQNAIRDAVVDQNSTAILPQLVGGNSAAYRLFIHQRHYYASLSRALARRFPAIAWLVGNDLLAFAAREYSHRFPPQSPVLREYGREFPQFLASLPAASSMPWLCSVGALEWHLGEVAAAIEEPACLLDQFAAFADAPLGYLHLKLQPGVAYVTAQWPVDELVRLRLAGNVPDSFSFGAMSVWLELRGARGAFSIRRMDADAYRFRQAVATGASLAIAIDLAAGADPGEMLARLFADKLVVSIARERE